ncbi:uncharacterized protein LOC141614066 [Silene latifolia]|uniref:uncharacterized protein LOC141614066 n=1 Tax=Silene latifolia TaxID=37657 RepID=UPI003D76ECF4
MIISSWNIRGLNDSIKQQEVRGYLWRNKVEVLGLLETRVKLNNFAAISRTFLSYVVMNNYSHHYNGRIWVFLDTRRVTLISSYVHDQFIHLELMHNVTNKTVHISFVYGSNDVDHRDRLWNELRSLQPKVTNWILMGDWNIVRSMEERIGPNPPSIKDMLAFNQCLLDCHLEDLQSFGCEFIWTNKREAITRVWFRLDRVLANPLWLVHFSSTQVNVLPSGVSDHSPLLVTITDKSQQNKRFSYLNCWEDHPDYGQVVKEAWDMPVRGNVIYRLFSRLKNVRQRLIDIHKNSYSGISGKVQEAQKNLHDCQSSLQANPLDPTMLAMEQNLLQTYLILKKAEHNSLLQRAKIQNIKYNDAPISYYFSRIAARKHQSLIGRIKDRQGLEREGMSDVNQAFVEYYQWLLGHHSPTDFSLMESLEGPRFPESGCEEICRELEFCNAIKGFFQSGNISKQANTTLLALIPKKSVVSTVMDYRPIACCTDFYKTVSKILCSRLKPFLPDIAGKEHGAFVGGRSNFWNMQKKSNHSESWRSILLARDELMAMAGCGDNVQALLGSYVRKGCLKLHLLYEHFRKKGSTISWANIAWNRAILPKHSVFLVMAMQQKLATIDQLNIRRIPIVNRCIMCKAANKTHKHLFFQFSYSDIVWRQLLAWMRVSNRTAKLSKELHWIAGRRACKHWKAKWYSSCLGAAVYSLCYYKTLLGTSDEVNPVKFSVVQQGRICTPEHCSTLLTPITDAEIKEAIFSIPSKLLRQINHTLITLIRKIEMPLNVTHFIPIACCNILYKAISKLLCARLTRVLPQIISENQRGFIHGRSIVENILFITWIMVCVQYPSYSFVLNGESFGFFKGAKGLRQGDPLSPLLFTIAIEYLSRILHYTASTMPFRYHPLCGRLKLYHLMFADDLLLFSKGDVQSIMILLRSFATFFKTIGLQMNIAKSNIYFNGVKNSVKDDIMLISSFTKGTLPFRYLGVPITAGRMNKKDSLALIDKVVERIRGFGNRKLSYARRLVLIQSVLTSLYTYWANIFLIPKGVLKAVDNICRNFLWDGNTECLRVPPVAWEKICFPKSEGDSKSALSGTKCELWYWKKICTVRDKMQIGFRDEPWIDKDYKVNDGYEWLRRKFPTVEPFT